jgi:head-tail adaptor
VSTGEKEDESSTGRVWAAGFHNVTARSRLVCVLKIMNLYFFDFPIFSGRVKPRIINQWVRGHACI